LAPGREERADAAVRPELEGPPAASRPSAAGHRLARLRPEGPTERIQTRGLQPVQRPADPPARGGDQRTGHPPAPHSATPPPSAARSRRPRRRRPQPPMGQMREIHEDPALATLQADDPAFDPADPTGGGVATLQRPRTNPKVDPNNPSTWGKVARNAPCPCG